MNERERDAMVDWPQWRIGATIDIMHACDALGIHHNIHALTFWLAEFQRTLYRGSKGLLGARSHAETWH